MDKISGLITGFNWQRFSLIAGKVFSVVISIVPDTTKPRFLSRLYHLNMVPVGGLEPPLLSETDFESVVYTNFTIPALSALLLDVIDYTQR